MIWWLIFLAAILVLFGIAYLRGKCDGFIAGYNTSSPEKQKEYDIRRLRLIVAVLLANTWAKKGKGASQHGV